MIFKVTNLFTLPQHLNNQILSILKIFRCLMCSQKLLDLTENLTRRTFKHYKVKPDEKQLSEFLRGTEFRNFKIYGADNNVIYKDGKEYD